MEEQQKQEETISLKKSTIWQIVSGVLLILLAISIFTRGFGYGSNGITGSAVVQGNNNNLPDTGAPANIKVSADDDPVLGDKNAPVTIIEFSDFQCPFCRKFWTESLPSIKKDYIDTGKVKLVFRDLPLEGLHPSALISAEAAECVREKGGDEAYWNYHDKIFEEQNILDSGSKTGQVTKTIQYSDVDLKNWAKDLGYDISSCLDSAKYKNEVYNDLDDAKSAGGRGTPYFVLLDKDGEVAGVISGAQPYSNFKSAIETTLAASN